MFGQFTVTDNVRVALTSSITNSTTSIMFNAAVSPFRNPADPNSDQASYYTGCATIYDSLSNPTKIEIITYTSLTDNLDGTFNIGGVTRGAQGTTAQAFSAGAVMVQAMTAAMTRHPNVTADLPSGLLEFTSLLIRSVAFEATSGVGTVNLTASGTVSLPAQSITRANLEHGAGFSIIGRSTGSTGVVADITASTGNTVILYNGSSVAFAKVPVAAFNTTGTANNAAFLRGDGAWSNTINGSFTVSSGFTVSAGSVSLPSNTLSRAALANGSATSVIGRSANSAGAVADIAASSDGQFLRRSGGTLGFGAMVATELPGGNWIGNTNGSSTQTTTNLTSNANAWEAITGTLALPSAGTYLVIAQVSGQLQPSAITATASLHARLYNVTDSAAIGTPAHIVSGETVGVYAAAAATIHAIVTVAATKTLRVEGMRRTDTGTTYTYSAIEGTANGGTRLSYIRLS